MALQMGLGSSVLWHFLYKNRSSGQMAAAAWEPPYVSAQEQERLVAAYLRLLHRISAAPRTAAAPDPGSAPKPTASFRILFHNRDKEGILLWVPSALPPSGPNLVSSIDLGR